MPTIWVGRTTRNGEKKGDGLSVWKNLLSFVLTMTWMVQLDFICINGDKPSETSHNLSRIGFQYLERVKLAIPLSSSLTMWLKVLWHKLP